MGAGVLRQALIFLAYLLCSIPYLPYRQIQLDFKCLAPLELGALSWAWRNVRRSQLDERFWGVSPAMVNTSPRAEALEPVE